MTGLSYREGVARGGAVRSGAFVATGFRCVNRSLNRSSTVLGVSFCCGASGTGSLCVYCGNNRDKNSLQFFSPVIMSLSARIAGTFVVRDKSSWGWNIMSSRNRNGMDSSIHCAREVQWGHRLCTRTVVIFLI